jgi:outer membrane scaffolding protein for murein synthesis (MipA/OmpV family)
LGGDQRLADTFYGVSASEATASRPVYAAQGGLIAWRLSGTVSRRLGPDVRLIAFGRADSLAGAANLSSPLVQRNSGLNVGLVLAYTWKQSESRAAD